MTTTDMTTHPAPTATEAGELPALPARPKFQMGAIGRGDWTDEHMHDHARPLAAKIEALTKELDALKAAQGEPVPGARCHGCGHIWRPADVPTNGVAAVLTAGKADSPIASQQPSPAPQAVATSEDTKRLDWLLENPNVVFCEGAANEWFTLDADSEPTYFKSGREAIDAARAAAGEVGGREEC